MNPLVTQQLIDFAYLAAAVLFILALKWLSSPVSARHGVLAGEIAAALAVGATLCNPELVQYKWIIVALIIGAGVGIPLGMVHMTAVPQRTALSHAFGALSATLIGIAEYYVQAPNVSKFGMVEIGLEVIIGSLTFSGQHNRGRQVAGASTAAADGLQRAEFRQLARRSPPRWSSGWCL